MLLLTLLLIFLLHFTVNMVLAAETLIDSYEYTNYSTVGIMHPTSSTGWGQLFYMENNYNLTGITFYFYKTGLPNAILSVKIYNISGYNSVPLATSEPFNTTTLSTSIQLHNISFTGENQITLYDKEYYVSLLSIDNYVLMNSSNYVRIGYDATSPTHFGFTSQTTSTQGYILTNYDTIFYLYGEPTEGPTTGISEEEVETAIVVAVMLSIIIASSVVGVVVYARKK